MSEKIDFDALPWQQAAVGARFKSFSQGGRRVRIVEFTSDFVEPDWCEKGHVGIVLRGELEIDFRGRRLRYAEGSGIFIAAGAVAAHKARSITPCVQLFLVEDG